MNHLLEILPNVNGTNAANASAMLQALITVTSFAPALTAATAQASVTAKVRSSNDAIRP
jgi:hypothetical protein